MHEQWLRERQHRRAEEFRRDEERREQYQQEVSQRRREYEKYADDRDRRILWPVIAAAIVVGVVQIACTLARVLLTK